MRSSLFSIPWPTLVIACLFDDSSFNTCEVIYHCSCDFHQLNDIWYLFMNLLVIFMSYLKNYLFNSTVQFITRLFGFFGIELYILFGILTSYQIKDLQIFSLIA